ncbi:MAG: FAD-binding oxidoreductase [bacterium]|nr:FAD-binding oxidoreductase [bacterium]
MVERTGCVVIGAGLMGLAVAHELGRRGTPCRVIERGRIACGTTSTTFAWLNATSKLEEDYHRLNVAGIEGHRGWVTRWGSDVTGHRWPGCLMWARADTATSLDDLDRTFDRLSDLDYPCRRVCGRELADLEPRIAFGHGAEGLLMPLDGWLDASRLARHLAEGIVRQGGDIHEEVPVTGFLGNAPVLDGVVTANGPVHADRIVIAAGTGTGDLAAMALASRSAFRPVGSDPGLLADIAEADAWLNHVVCFPEGEDELHMRPNEGGRLLMGADGADRMLPDEVRARRHLADRVQHYLVGLDAADVMTRMTSRVGHRPMPADGRSIVGHLPGCDNLFVAVTHSGITLAPAVGALVADEITGSPVSPLLQEFRPDRFAWT